MTLMPSDQSPSPDGLQQLLGMIAGQFEAPMARTLGFRLVAAEKGQVVFEGRPDQSVYNPLGSVHGGYAATLLDSACGLAVHSRLGPDKGHSTLERKVSYLRGLTTQSGPVRAVVRAISVGRRVAFAEATLHDAEGRLCATATSTLIILDVEAGPGGVLHG